jgi:hypothetical protein
MVIARHTYFLVSVWLLPSYIFMLSQALSPIVLILFAIVGTSAWDYIFMGICIFLLHLVAPLRVIYSLAVWLARLPLYVPHVLGAWLALVATFFPLIFLPRKVYLHTAAKHPTTT